MSIKLKDGTLDRFEKSLTDKTRGVGKKLYAAQKEGLLAQKGTLPYRPSEISEKEIEKKRKLLLKCVSKAAGAARYKDGRRVVPSSNIKVIVPKQNKSDNVSQRRYIHGENHLLNRKEISIYDPRYKKHAGEGRYDRDVKAIYVPIKVYFTGKIHGMDMTDKSDIEAIKKRGGYVPFPAYTSGHGGNYYYKQSRSPKLNSTTYGIGTFVYMPYIANNQPVAKDYVYWTDYTAEPIGYYKSGEHKGEPIYPRYRSEKQWRSGRNPAAKGFVDKAAQLFIDKSRDFIKMANGYKTVIRVNINPIYK